MQCIDHSQKFYLTQPSYLQNGKYFFYYRFAACPSSWVQLDLCLPGGRGENHSFVICRQLIFNSIQVFNHDWFATPFVLTTCQPNGAFDSPDWSTFSCVLRKLFLISTHFKFEFWKPVWSPATTTECFDCTTTSKINHYTALYSPQSKQHRRNLFWYPTQILYVFQDWRTSDK